jgi:DNA processing protein
MDSIKYWIAFERVQGVGPAHLKEVYSIISSVGVSLSDIFELSEDEIKNEFNFNQKTLSAIDAAKGILHNISEEYQKIIDEGITVTPFFSKNYPARLHETLGNSIPPILYSYGNIDLLKRKGASILGDNNISGKGELIAYMAAKELSARGITVISGFAEGADMTAHRSALEWGGDTIAFLPYGIFKIKIPEQIKHVFDEVRFLAVSTFQPEAAAGKYNAFARNKILSALSYAVYIVESPEEGGIFEAAKSAHNLKIPLYTTEYSEYPKNAGGNKKIVAELGGFPVRGKRSDNLTLPNLDRLIADVKFK